MTERQLQDHVRSLLAGNELKARIRNREKIESDAANAGAFPGYPQFPIDSLAREKALLAAQHVLAQLSTTKILSETANISLRRDERLLPDFVLYNPDQGSFLIVELKTSAKTEREALTELYGYEHELQNQFPFLSTYDVSFLLIAADYSPLLDHSASAIVTWGNRKLMCLRASQEGERIEFDIHLPTPWTALGQDQLPLGGLATATLCLYRRDGDETEDHFDYASRALEFIAQEGDRNHVHGFAFLWKSVSPGSLAPYSITVAAMNPFAFVSHAVEQGFQVDARLHSKIFAEGDDPTQTQPSAIFSVARRAHRLLSEVFEPMWEGLDNWDAQRQSLSRYTVPIAFRFFGTLGEFVTELTLNAETRMLFLPGLDVGGLDPGNPRVGIQILDRLTGNILFCRGRFTCKDITAFGILLGSLRTLCATAKPGTPETLLWRAIIEWRETELLLATAEIVDRRRAMVEPIPDSPQLIVGWGGNAEEKIAAITAYADWFASEFLRPDAPDIYRRFFSFGISGHAWLDGVIRGSLGEGESDPHRAKVLEFARRTLNSWVVAGVTDPEVNEEFRAEVKRIYHFENDNPADLARSLGKVTDKAVLESAAQELPGLIDLIIPPLFHKLRKPNLAGLDWTWLRDQVSARRKEGVRNIGVIVQSDGTVGIGRTPWFGADPSEEDGEVFVQVDVAGVAATSKTTWSELDRGDVFWPGEDQSTGN